MLLIIITTRSRRNIQKFTSQTLFRINKIYKIQKAASFNGHENKSDPE